MRLLVSDTNILLDWDQAARLAVVFDLGATVIVPDVLLFEELMSMAARLHGLGLQTRSLSPESIVRALSLTTRHRRPSRVDLLALALAEQERCTLLTGDRHLRDAAEEEGVEVHGTLWIGERALERNVLQPEQLRAAYTAMRAAGRRLPWDEIERQLRRWGAGDPR